jgi:hypothetical protein
MFGSHGTIFEDIPDVIGIAGSFLALVPKGNEVLVQIFGEDLFTVHTTDAGPPALRVDHLNFVLR